MTIHLIASGETASHWDGSGPSIGVNDCAKWGHSLNYLILVNRPNQFQSSRLETIVSTKPSCVYTNTPEAWGKYFDKIKAISTRKWSRGSKLSQSTLYHSKTSPIIGLSLAYSWGFNNIVMWGVDMITHHRFGRGQSAHLQEMMQYNSFIKALNQQGVKVFIGANGTAFDTLVPVWDKAKYYLEEAQKSPGVDTVNKIKF